jgi:hypothetical protein
MPNKFKHGGVDGDAEGLPAELGAEAQVATSQHKYACNMKTPGANREVNQEVLC